MNTMFRVIAAACASALAVGGVASAGVMTVAEADLTAGGMSVCDDAGGPGGTVICDGNDQAGTVAVLDLPGANVSVSAIVGEQLTELLRLEPANDGADVMDDLGSLIFDTGSDSAGTVSYDFSGAGLTALYVAIKGGSEFALLKIVADAMGDGVSGSFDFDLDALGIASATSHVTFYGVQEIPIPAAIWLMGAGLAGLGFAAGRRKKAV